jgi:hypothetical protein
MSKRIFHVANFYHCVQCYLLLHVVVAAVAVAAKLTREPSLL